MRANPGFQVSLDLMGRLCLVIGGDEEAAEKTLRLLDAEAKVVVVSPTMNDTLRKLTASGKVIHRGRHFRSTDAQGVFFVLNVLRNDTGLSKSLFELAKTERFLLWSVDQPELSTVMMPAVVNRGHLRLAISTSGASPVLASALRQESEQLFDDEFVKFLEWLGTLREKLRQDELDDVKRHERLREAVNGFHLTGTLAYPKSWIDERAKSGSVE